MDTFQAIIMGLVQGLSEYLPISSSGHLEICKDLLGMDVTGAQALEFSVALHVATVLSTIVVLWREFVPLCKSFVTFRRDSNFYYVLKILVSCIPVAIVGVLFKDKVEEIFGGNLTVVGVCLIITAALLSFAYFTRTREQLSRSSRASVSPGHDIGWIDAFVIGLAQAAAVLPGLSRSGSTIATGILLGDRREKVAQFSFFMVIIPILGEALLDIKDLITGEAAISGAVGIVPLLAGFITAFIVGCLACKWMLSLVKRGKLVWFAIYCVIVGVLCLLF